MNNEKWQGRSAKLLFAFLLLFIIYIVIKYAFGIILPFLIGFTVSIPLSSFARRSYRAFGGKEKHWAVFYTVVFWLLLLTLVWISIGKLFDELEELLVFVGENSEQIGRRLSKLFEKIVSISSRLPIFQSLGEGLLEIGDRAESLIKQLLGSVAKKGSEMVGSIAARIAIGTPKAIAGIAVSVVSSFYFCKDREKIKNYFLGILNKDSESSAKKVYSGVSRGLRAYLKAYLWIFLITLIELFIGFIILKRKYAFVTALLVALLDILPLFGAGFILIPWGIILIADGTLATGVGMFVLFATVFVVRQIAEPRLVGKEMGIHPLATLAAMYVGFSIFGFSGMLLAPIGVVVFKEINKEKLERDFNE